MVRPYLAPDGENGARRSLVLAGGGMRVAYQAGALAALDEAGLRFHHVDGASGGTMNLSMILSGLEPRELCERWRTLDPRGFLGILPLREYVRSPHWPALGGNDGLRGKVFPHLGIDIASIRAADSVVGTYNVANFATKQAEVVEHPEVDLDLLVAAVSLPVLMPAVLRSGTAYTDAVWIRDSNVPEAVRRGSDEVWLVWCIGNTPTYANGLFRQYVHMIEMAATGSLLGDLAHLGCTPGGDRLRLHVIKPEVPLPLDPSYLFGRIDAAALVDLGYQDARRYLADPKPFVSPFGPDVTRMRAARPGTAVRLALEGPFALGLRDPLEGGAEGETRGTTLRVHLRVDGPAAGDAYRVAGDVCVPGRPEHELVSGGTACLANGIAVELRVGCAGAGGSHTLRIAGSAGHALEATLQDSGGETVGAGVLPFGRQQLARALATLSATNSVSMSEAWRARTALSRTLWRAARG